MNDVTLKCKATRVLRRHFTHWLRRCLKCPDAWGYLIGLLKSHPKAVYLDIGAHTGFTLERITDECRNEVHGFEPTPDSFSKLASKYANNQQVRLWNIACSDQTGKTRFFLNANSQTNSLLDNAAGNQQYFPEHTEHTGNSDISTVRLDDWITSSGLGKNTPLMIKCDVQGAEMKLIDGARNTLKNQCLVFYTEIQLIEMYQGQATFSHINHALTEELGFVLKDVYPCMHDRSGRALQFDAMWVKPSVLKQ